VVKKPVAALPDGKRRPEIAGGPLGPMLDHDVSHPYRHMVVEDD
jgi:hypothetical protein